MLDRLGSLRRTLVVSRATVGRWLIAHLLDRRLISTEARAMVLLYLFLLSLNVIMGGRKHPFLAKLPDMHDVINRINKRFDQLFFEANGKKRCYVCSICDEFLDGEGNFETLTLDALQKCKDLLSWECMPDVRRKASLEACYSFEDNQLRELGSQKGVGFVKSLALSPRGSVYQKRKRGSKAGITCCSTCKNMLNQGKRPHFAIINRYYFGTAPKILCQLNNAELALLTPVKHHGYCFTYLCGRETETA